MTEQKLIITSPEDMHTFASQNPKGIKCPGDRVILVDGSLDLRETDIERLPGILIVAGDMNIVGCDKLCNFPAALFITGKLYVSFKQIKFSAGNLGAQNSICAKEIIVYFDDDDICRKNVSALYGYRMSFVPPIYGT